MRKFSSLATIALWVFAAIGCQSGVRVESAPGLLADHHGNFIASYSVSDEGDVLNIHLPGPPPHVEKFTWRPKPHRDYANGRGRFVVQEIEDGSASYWFREYESGDEEKGLLMTSGQAR